ncbi:PaaX family transcriptional regulator [Hoyosella sp. YIM 151337]|uniref:PaaX family transcriptional regulator n=1 Tax=Hoyosella sp. YIM 151337 TaxID=2992742 RepID=UPI002235DD47|nr:PaaX family transcriptional regulator C-terminal domain-containing protein [Hoyosella sp. YIM 151337]MCW4354658.1 PaaX family transcriptional regulator [Hoyosella sp. YIM 151337]
MQWPTPPDTVTDDLGATESAVNPPRRLIVTIYALYARETQNWLSVSSLVRLLGDLGVDEPSVRSSISRLKRRGILVSHRKDGVVGYALSESALDIIHEGDQRIFHTSRASVSDGWLMAVFSIPESERGKRHAIRTILTSKGFGTTAPGVWIAPAHLQQGTADALRAAGLDQFVDLFRAEHIAFADLREKVAQWWNLDQLHELYAEFIDQFQPLYHRVTDRPEISPRDAFVAYVQMLTTWRRLPYLDPGLPLELLPGDWNGATAATIFNRLQQVLAEPAHDHVRLLLS